MTWKEVLSLYRKRQQIEETIRQLKQECCIKDCQVQSLTAQINHFFLSLFAFCILERKDLKEIFPFIFLGNFLFFEEFLSLFLAFFQLLPNTFKI